MENKKKNMTIGVIVSVVVVLFIVFGTLACLGIFREFNAQRYVSAVLDQTLKGDVEDAVEMVDGATEEALYTQYEAGISSFVKNSLTSGTELTTELEKRYTELCKKVFASMKYEVQEAEKISDEEFQVPVKYQPSDILQKFIVSVTAEAQRLNEKVENGEYRGTLEEINTQMKEEFMNNSCDLFEEAYNSMEFGEEQTIVLKVVKGEDDLYELEESAITEFLVKILSLDAKED